MAAKSAPKSAIVIGASGGIGAALAETLRDEGDYAVTALSRSATGDDQIDIADEGSIARAAERCADLQPDLILLATGLLHDGDLGPEKAMRDLDADWLARQYLVNAIGPALVAKHFLPIMKTGGITRFAALSARVGSISDNRLGGWYGYRASKAALNMFMKTAAIEYKRRCPCTIVVSLHPGTTDTRLSKPFQDNVPEEQLFSVEHTVGLLTDVMSRLKPEDSGEFYSWNGNRLPW